MAIEIFYSFVLLIEILEDTFDDQHHDLDPYIDDLAHKIWDLRTPLMQIVCKKMIKNIKDGNKHFFINVYVLHT